MQGKLQWIILLAVATALGAASWQYRPLPSPLKIIYPRYFGNRINIPVDNPTTVEGVALGRMLFYETALSLNNQLSCATCHQQSRAFTDGLAFSVGVDGKMQPRNSMSLANLLWVRQFFWDGRSRGLEKQVETPLTGEHEMGQTLEASVRKLEKRGVYRERFLQAFGTAEINGDRIRRALAQFERTLVSANSRYDGYLQGSYQPTPSEQNGIRLFYAGNNATTGERGAGCGNCHGGPKTYTEFFHNNGLDSLFPDAGRRQVTGSDVDLGRFRVTTLRNIALTAPYMHDGRFNTLTEVVDHYSDHIVNSTTLAPALRDDPASMSAQARLSRMEKKDLLAFLNMLTDSVFIQNPSFSNPFIK